MGDTHFESVKCGPINADSKASPNSFFAANTQGTTAGKLLIDATAVPSWSPAGTGFTAGDVPLIKCKVGATTYCVVLTSGGAVAVRTIT